MPYLSDKLGSFRVVFTLFVSCACPRFLMTFLLHQSSLSLLLDRCLSLLMRMDKFDAALLIVLYICYVLFFVFLCPSSQINPFLSFFACVCAYICIFVLAPFIFIFPFLKKARSCLAFTLCLCLCCNHTLSWYWPL